MKKKNVAIIMFILVIAILAVVFKINKPYQPMSFVADGENFSATVESGATLLLDLDNANENKVWSIIREADIFASDYNTVTENVSEFHIIALNDGKGEMLFQCENDDGTTEEYILGLSISRHQKKFLQIDSVSFIKNE